MNSVEILTPNFWKLGVKMLTSNFQKLGVKSGSGAVEEKTSNRPKLVLEGLGAFSLVRLLGAGPIRLAVADYDMSEP